MGMATYTDGDVVVQAMRWDQAVDAEDIIAIAGRDGWSIGRGSGYLMMLDEVPGHAILFVGDWAVREQGGVWSFHRDDDFTRRFDPA